MEIELPKFKKKDIPVYEHLEFYLKKTTYADRLQWLEDANEFLRQAQKVKIIKKK